MPRTRSTEGRTEHQGENVVVAVHFEPAADGKSEITRIHSIYPKNTGSTLGWIREGLATYYHKEKAQGWLSPRIARTKYPARWGPSRAGPAVAL
jgi:hypothetical protein